MQHRREHRRLPELARELLILNRAERVELVELRTLPPQMLPTDEHGCQGGRATTLNSTPDVR